jgi:uncharacterized membrane protein YfcA
MSAGDWLLFLVAGVAGGLAGSIAGLASVATYPALLATGLGPVAANVTNTVSLLAYTAGSVTGSRPELTGQAPRARRLGAAALLGGAAGCALLLLTSERTFERIAPLLIAGASLAIMARPRPRPQPQPGAGHGDAVWLPVGVFLVGIYGGYFGAASGVIMLALLLLGTGEALARANGLRNVLLGFANGVASVGFALLAPVEWLAIVPLAAGLFVGGRLGPIVVRHAPAGALRALIGLAGLTLAVVLAIGAY